MKAVVSANAFFLVYCNFEDSYEPSQQLLTTQSRDSQQSFGQFHGNDRS